MSKNRTTLVLSDELRRLLHRTNNHDAREILNMEGCDLEKFPYAYLDITTSPETLSFILSDKCNDVDDVWHNNRRTQIRCGKVFNKILLNSSTEDIEKLVNEYKAKYKAIYEDAFGRFKIVEGAEIKKYYNARTYISNDSTLAKSCMRYDDCGYWLNLYTKNPESVKMVILYDLDYPTKIAGRALLWDLTYPEGKKFMDRIYYAYDSDRNLFIEFAKQNGWLYRNAQRIDNLDICDPSGKNLGETHLTAKVRRFRYKHFPFVDTLRYYHKGQLANWMFNDSCIELRDGHGGFIDPNSIRNKLKRELRESSLDYIWDMYGEHYVLESMNTSSYIDRYIKNIVKDLEKSFMKTEYSKDVLLNFICDSISFNDIRRYNQRTSDIVAKYEMKGNKDLSKASEEDLKIIINELGFRQNFVHAIEYRKHRDRGIKSILRERYDEIDEEAINSLADWVDWTHMINRIIDDATRDEEPTVFDEGPFEEEPADVSVSYDDVESDGGGRRSRRIRGIPENIPMEWINIGNATPATIQIRREQTEATEAPDTGQIGVFYPSNDGPTNEPLRFRFNTDMETPVTSEPSVTNETSASNITTSNLFDIETGTNNTYVGVESPITVETPVSDVDLLNFYQELRRSSDNPYLRAWMDSPWYDSGDSSNDTSDNQ